MLLNPFSDRDVFEIDEAEQVARDWWLYLLAGIISIVFGALILSIDWGVDSLAAFVGALFIIQGAAWAITRPLDGGTRSTNLIAGGLGLPPESRCSSGRPRALHLAAFIGIWIVFSGLSTSSAPCQPPCAPLVARVAARRDRGADRFWRCAGRSHPRRGRHARRGLGDRDQDWQILIVRGSQPAKRLSRDDRPLVERSDRERDAKPRVVSKPTASPCSKASGIIVGQHGQDRAGSKCEHEGDASPDASLKTP
jgi:hypothetical protein